MLPITHETSTTVATLQDLSNQELLGETQHLAHGQRDATARLVAAIAEVDARRLYLGEGCSSMFVYCTRVLLLSEYAAYLRIEAARLSRRFPVILERLADGSLTLTNVSLLAPHLTEDNHEELLADAMHCSKRELEELLAARFGAAVPPRAGLFVHALDADYFRVEFVVPRETLDKLRRSQDLLSHSVPDGDPAIVLDKALTLLLEAIGKEGPEPRRSVASTAVDAPRGRYIPRATERAVWKRDRGQCAFVGTQGRCGETRFLEVHHRQPYAAGGRATVENLELRCRAHNVYAAELFFGRSKTSRAEEPATQPAESGEESATQPVETRSGPS